MRIIERLSGNGNRLTPEISLADTRAELTGEEQFEQLLSDKLAKYYEKHGYGRNYRLNDELATLMQELGSDVTNRVLEHMRLRIITPTDDVYEIIPTEYGREQDG